MAAETTAGNMLTEELGGQATSSAGGAAGRLPMASEEGESPDVSTSPLLRGLGRWVVALVAVRDAVGRLPAIPPVVWLGGVLLVLAARASQTIRFRRQVRAGSAAPASVVRLVAEAARAVGLRATPETVMVQDRISPMVWCGRKASLVLPRALWSELDEDGRRAVVFHELAHIRRRDHWVCWIELVFGAVYWWHPLIWWVRSRLREEAENCCDAWVTWLLPQGRRAYAEALISARRFTTEPAVAVPSPGIGVITGRTKRFTRRLTMVMTEQATPNRSVTGMVLALSMVVAAWAATPARSSEPGEKVAPESEALAVTFQEGGPTVTISAPAVELATEIAVALPSVAVTPVPTVAPVPSLLLAVGDDDAQKGRGGRPNMRDLERRIERLERQLDEISEQLDKMSDAIKGPEMPIVLERLKQLGQLEQLRELGQLGQLKPLERLRQLGQSYAPRSQAKTVPGSDEGVIVRTYKVPEGRLEALTKLMIRPDVPTRVRQVDGGIEVHATKADHATFKAFVDIITVKEDTKVGYRLPEEKLKALTELMTRGDVPVMVSPGEDEITVHGGPAVQSVFGAFVNMIHPSDGTCKGSQGGVSVDPGRIATEAKQAARRAYEHAVKAHKASGTKQSKGSAGGMLKTPKAQHAMQEVLAKTAKLQREFEKLTQMAAELESKAEQIESDAEVLEAESDELFDEAQKLRDEASETDNHKQAARLRDKAEELEKRADSKEKKARELFKRAQEVEEKAREVEEHAEEIERDIDELENQAAEIEDEGDAEGDA
ncbi:MAG: hypothetical protein JXQ75_06520 [Phycisphaerae bacterium]|nr:hypothetical protein [Phycisphaerae bacterium]